MQKKIEDEAKIFILIFYTATQQEEGLKSGYKNQKHTSFYY